MKFVCTSITENGTTSRVVLQTGITDTGSIGVGDVLPGGANLCLVTETGKYQRGLTYEINVQAS